MRRRAPEGGDVTPVRCSPMRAIARRLEAEAQTIVSMTYDDMTDTQSARLIRAAELVNQARNILVVIDLEIDGSEPSYTRALRLFVDYPEGCRVSAEIEMVYVCDEVDGRLPAGSLGTIVRRVMPGLYLVRWDVMPAHELQTSADCLVPVDGGGSS